MDKSQASAGGIVLGPDGRVVIVCQHGNSWSFPKGHVEDGESELAAAKREIFEETGITDAQFVRDLGSYERYSIGKDGTGEDRGRGLRRRIFFLFRTRQATLKPQETEGEITEARFVSPDEVLAMLTHPKDRAFFEQHMEEITALQQR